MKKIFTWMLCAALFAGMTGCSYDDDDLWNEVNDIKQEQAEMKQLVEKLKKSVEDGAVITKVEKTEKGYKMTLSNGEICELLNGTKGEDGDSKISNLEIGDDTVTITLQSGEVLELPMVSGVVFSLKEKSVTLRPGQTATVAYQAEGIEEIIVSVCPEGYTTTLDEQSKTLLITAPNGSKELGDGNRLALLAADKDGRTLLAALTLAFNPMPEKGGLMVVNEGWLGHDPGSVSIYYNGGWSPFAYQWQNAAAEKTLGATTTMCVKHNGYYYFVSKNEPCVVEATAQDLVFHSELSSGSFGQGCSIAVYDDTKAYVSAMNGLFEIGINPLSEGKQVFESRNGGGDVAVAGGKVYFIDQRTLYVYDPAAGGDATELGEAQTGFAELDGALWCGNATTLTRINTADASVTTHTLDTAYPLFAESTYRARQIAASDGAIYFLSGSGWSCRNVCKYDIATGQTTRLWTTPDGYSVYGSGLSFDATDNHLYVTYVEDGWGDHYKVNYIAALSTSGSLREKIDYTGYFWFPSNIIFL